MIKAVQKEDYKDFMEMANEFYNSSAVSGSISEETIISTFNNIVSNSPYIRGYLLYVDEKIAGFFTIAFSFQTQYGKKVLLFEDLYIRPDFQGQSLGTKVFMFLEDKYKAEVGAIRLEVSNENVRAKELYERLGYKKNSYYNMIKEF